MKHLLDQHLPTIPPHKWVSKLFGYTFSMIYRHVRQNTAADALSRCDKDARRARTRAVLTRVCHLRRLQKGGQTPGGMAVAAWNMVDGFIMHRSHVFVPLATSLWPQLLATAHGTGHEGAQKKLHRFCASYNPHASRLVRNYIKGCDVCQRNKSEHLHPAGLLQLSLVAYSNGLRRGFHRAGGKSVVLIVVDCFSKYAHFIAVGHTYTATSIARVFFDQIVHLHCLPCSIVSDRDPVFTSKLWTNFFTLAGVKLRLNSAFRSQTDGQSEVTNSILGIYLRCLAVDRPCSWLHWLPWAEYCYNSYQSALQATPFQVVYGRLPLTLLSYEPRVARVFALDRQL